MGKPQQSAPQAPDPSYVSSQQTQSNVNTAISNAWLNNVDQHTPYGSLTYNQNGGQFDNAGNWIPRFTATQTLSPEQQRLYDTRTRVEQGAYDLADQYTSRIADATAQPFNYNGLPAAPVYNEDYRKQQLQAIQDRAAPQMERDRAALEQRLANQGIALGSDAWKAAMDDRSRSVNDFNLGADVQAGNAAAQQYSLEGQTRDRAIQERANLRSQPINEVAALLGTGSGVQNPSFVPTNNYAIQPTDVSGNYWNAYQGQIAQQQAQQRQQNAAMGGLFGLAGSLGSAAIMASDVRLKENIVPVGRSDNGTNLYLYNFKGESAPRIGPMAQEVELTNPGAVIEHPDGYKMVDYNAALGKRRG